MLHLILEHSLLHLKWLGYHRCSRSRFSIPLRWKTIDRSHFSRSISKTIERAASKQVTEFLARNNLLDPNQSGFKSGYSNETALLSVTEALKTARVAALGPIIRSHGFSYLCYADDTQLFQSFPPEDTTVSARIS